MDDSRLSKGLLSPSELVKRQGLVSAHLVDDIQLMNRQAVIYSHHHAVSEDRLDLDTEGFSEVVGEQHSRQGADHATAQRHLLRTVPLFHQRRRDMAASE